MTNGNQRSDESTLAARVDALLDAILDAVEDQQVALGDAVERALRDETEEVKRAVRSLVPGLFAEGDLLDQGAFGAAPALGERLAESSPGRRPLHGDPELGDCVGPYRLVEILGRGGMGVVYLAERADDQYRQKVAMKLLGGYGARGRERFLRERQFLADLNHPGIARLLDGGVLESGDPYLVMEFVEGVPIDRHCLDQELSVEQSLDLVLEVCDAVQYAHQRLILHCDIKPANVLVTTEGNVKLLDFGIARLIDAEGGEAQATMTTVRAFTPEYASPEQLRGERPGIPSDVYSLGALVYRLLTGIQPHDVGGLVIADATSKVLEEPTMLPSRAVESTLVGDRSSRIKRLRGDLDNIVLKALAKEPDARYATVAELAEDLRRHLRGLPVNARAATVGYRARKFAARHRLAIGALLAVFASLVVGASMALLQAREAATQRDLARVEANKAESVASFLVELFGSADPFAEGSAEPSARDLLERGERRISSELRDAPAARAQLLTAIGVAYAGLGDTARAAELTGEALTTLQELSEATPAELARVGIEHAAIIARRDPATARRLLVEADEVLLRDGLSSSILRARIFAGLAWLDDTEQSEKEALFRRALELRRGAGEHSSAEVANLLQSLGSVHERRGDIEESVRLKRQSLQMIEHELGREHPMFFQVTNNLANALLLQGDLAGAERHFREATQGLARRLGDEHPALGNPYSNLGKVLLDLGRRDEASRFIEIAARLGGSDQESTFSSTARNVNLATLRREQGEFEEALQLYGGALSFMQERLGRDHPAAARIESLIGQTLRLRGAPQAREMLERALEIQEQQDAASVVVAETRRHLGGLLCSVQEEQRGRPLVEAACSGFVDSERDPMRFSWCLLERAECDLAARDSGAASRSLVEAASLIDRLVPEDHHLRDRLGELQEVLRSVGSTSEARSP